MLKIAVRNNISEAGLALFPASDYAVAPAAADDADDAADDADAIIVRSANLHEMAWPERLKAIARAGTGVNNIPIQACTERGIAVFNTPGANANGVKELVIAALLLSSRRIYQGIGWTQTLAGRGDAVAAEVERGKAAYAGPELNGKRLGVIGLGAIGVMVANDALALGMEVIGYDRFLSVESAWGLSRHVTRASSVEQVLAAADYITVHVPLNDSTRGMLGSAEFKLMRPGVRIINLARGELVDNADILRAIENDVVACYVTDFPTEELLGSDRIITFPHLGASTPESEDNSVAMAVRQLRGFLERGVVAHSVNFPDCDFAAIEGVRISVAHLNVPGMIGQMTACLAARKFNISELLNHHRESLGYTIIDVDGAFDPAVMDEIRAIDGVKQARLIRS